MRNLIKDELINYIRSIYGSDDNLHTMLYEYKNQGKEAFFEDLDKAAACIENISDYRMKNIFESLRDAVPVFRGVILGQKMVSSTDNIILDDIYDSLSTQDESPEFVCEWGCEHSGESTLCRSSFAVRQVFSRYGKRGGELCQFRIYR